MNDAPLWSTFTQQQHNQLSTEQLKDLELKTNICQGISHPRIR